MSQATAPERVPTTTGQWEQHMRIWAKQNDPLRARLTGFGRRQFDSASKLKYEDWLLLRVIWSEKDGWPTASELFGPVGPAFEAEARNALQALPWWKAVGDGVSDPLSYGHMAAWRHSLNEIFQRRPDNWSQDADDFYDDLDASKLIVETPRRQTRSTTGNAPPPTTQGATMITPTHRPGEQSPPGSSFDRSAYRTVTPPTQMQPSGKTPPSDASYQVKLPARHRPDEAVINMSLVLFLQGIFMTFKSVGYEWTVLHNQFSVAVASSTQSGIVEPAYNLMLAKTDGCLQAARSGVLLEDGDSLAIIEVKPYRRLDSSSETRSIRVQEGAEMAAWISTECTKGLLPSTRKKTYRRVILAQDFDEVYITVAEFDDEYIKYIRGQADDEDDNPFPSPPKAAPSMPAPKPSSSSGSSFKKGRDPAPSAPGSKTKGSSRTFFTRSKARDAAKAHEVQITEQMKALTIQAQNTQPSPQPNPPPSQGPSGTAGATSPGTGGFLRMYEYGSFQLRKGRHVQHLAVLLLALTKHLCRAHRAAAQRQGQPKK